MVAKQYPNQALTRAITRANEGCDELIPRLTVHGLCHTFAAISLSEAEADLLSVSQAMGHARPSITLDRYGHLSKKGFAPLMAKIDALDGVSSLMDLERDAGPLLSFVLAALR